MSKLQFLVLSALASGFGLCSVVFATFTLFIGLNFWSFFRLFLALAFFGINFLFVAYYYNAVKRDLKNRRNRDKIER
jgi:hypothetical protein